jgi:hypothetical protein
MRFPSIAGASIGDRIVDVEISPKRLLGPHVELGWGSRNWIGSVGAGNRINHERALRGFLVFRGDRRGFGTSYSPSLSRAPLRPPRDQSELRQASFRDAALSAYGGRCAISYLPEPRLLDAAHIVTDEQLGQPIVSNGLPLTKLHHAAFDAHLIGIDADYRIHVSDPLLEIHDGPFLELGLKGIVGTLIELPRRSEDRPDRDRLAMWFELFKKSA